MFFLFVCFLMLLLSVLGCPENLNYYYFIIIMIQMQEYKCVR